MEINFKYITLHKKALVLKKKYMQTNIWKPNLLVWLALHLIQEVLSLLYL